MLRFSKNKKVLVAAAVAAMLLVIAPAARAVAGCGDFNKDGSVTATDALAVLGVAIGSGSCALARCDIDSNGTVAATDALGVLMSAVGQPVALTCPGVAVSEITDLPRATAPVTAAATGDAFAFSLAALAGDAPGIVLGEMDSTTFGSSSSMAACQIANMTKIAVTSTAEADKVLCYIQNAFADAGDGSIDIYDGNYHVFALDFGEPMPGAPPEEHGGPSLIRMRLGRTGATITDFELFACQDGPSGPVQNEYIHQAISTTDFSMVAKGTFTDPWGNSNGHQVDVEGELNDAGQFVGTKLITMSHTSTWPDGGTGYGEMVVAQGADDVGLDGYDAGEFSDGLEDYLYSNRVTALAELFDLNMPGEQHQLGNLALGDGAAKVTMRHGTRYSWSDFTEVQGWNAETTQVDYEEAAEYVELVLDADLPEVGEVAIEFAEGESYGCDDEPEAVVSIDMVDLEGSCAHLELGHEWIDCFSAINGGPDAGGGPPPPDGGACTGPDCSCAAADTCGGQAPGGCFCDEACVEAGDCCPDACDVCGQCGQPCDGPDCGPGCPPDDPYCQPACPPDDPNCEPACPPDNPDCQPACPPDDPYCEPACPPDDPYCEPACPPDDPYCEPACPPDDPYCEPACPPDDPYCEPACPPDDPNCEPACPPDDPYCEPACPPDDPYCEPACPPDDPNCEPACPPDDPYCEPACPPDDPYCEPACPPDDPYCEPACPPDDPYCEPACPPDDPYCEPACPPDDPYCEPACPPDDPYCEPACPPDDPYCEPACPPDDPYCEPACPPDDPNCEPACPPDDPYCEPACPPDDPYCEPGCPPDDPNCELDCPPDDPSCDDGPDCPPDDPSCAPEVCDGPDCSCAAAGVCGDQAPGGCFCDAECVEAGDCCADACDVCGHCGP